MSPKELLYLDDALGHEQFLIAQCGEAGVRAERPAAQAMRASAAKCASADFQSADGRSFKGGGFMNNDQQIMENLLLTTKGVCDLYLQWRD